MTRQNDYVVYAPLPPNSNATPQNVIVLPFYHHPPPIVRLLRRFLISLSALLLISLAVYLLYPYDPSVQLVRLRLNNVRVNSSPKLTLDLSFSVTVKVHNPDLFSLDYQSMVVSVGYRGRELGFVTSAGGRVKATGSSYLNATLDLNGFEVMYDVFYLLEDLARGVIPFDTVSQVNGALGFFFFKIPIKAKLSCEVYVNTSDQTVVHQDCYPE